MKNKIVNLVFVVNKN